MWLGLVCLSPCGALADEPDDLEWREDQVVFPAYPREDDLVEFYVSPTAVNRFSIDASTIKVGGDGVVRYVLVVKTPEGGTNVSFEGIHCTERQVKVYAFGGVDRTWHESQGSAWKLIESVDRHHAALNRDYFCPYGTPVRTPAEARQVLRKAATAGWGR